MTDRTADQVEGRLDTHEKVCTERYGNIWDALKDLKNTANADRISRASSDQSIHDRFNAISARMWTAVASVCGAAVVGLGAVVFYLLTRGHP